MSNCSGNRALNLECSITTGSRIVDEALGLSGFVLQARAKAPSVFIFQRPLVSKAPLRDGKVAQILAEIPPKASRRVPSGPLKNKGG
jgi:hypothetical protein